MKQQHLGMLREVVIVLGLALLPFVIFWQIWTPNPADQRIFGGDILMGAYPTRVLVHRLRELQHSVLWNPYQLGGMPLLADIQVAVYYPPNVVLDWVYQGRDISYRGFELLVIAHYSVGGLLCYGYLRNRSLYRIAAVAGAVSFMFNGFLIGHRGHYNMMATAIWLPGILWWLDQTWSAATLQKQLLWGSITAIGISCMVLAGHPQLLFYCGLWIIGYSGFRLVHRWKHTHHKHWKPTLREGFTTIVIGCWGIAGAMVALLPALELLQRSLRNTPTYAFNTQYSLLPRNLIGLLMPDFLGWGMTEYRLYAGIFPLGLSLLVLFYGWQYRAERRFWAASIMLATISALGGFTILQGVLYRFVPGFSAIRISVRMFYLANVALAMLTAYSVHMLAQPIAKRYRQRLHRSLHYARYLLVGAGSVGAMLLIGFVLLYQPVGEEFFFADTLFNRTPSPDRWVLLTQVSSAYGIFMLLVGASVILLWWRLRAGLRARRFGVFAVGLIVLDLATFAPSHDSLAASPDTLAIQVQNYQTTILREAWQIAEQQQLIDATQRLPDLDRIDNRAEVLPDNYSAVWQVPFSTGYNVLDLQERSQLLQQWPVITDTIRWDLLNVGAILTLPNQPPPEANAQLVISNSQGTLWARQPTPTIAYWSRTIRPITTLKSINGMLAVPNQPIVQQPSIAPLDESYATMRDRWMALQTNQNAMIGTTMISSPVDISVLAGGALGYSAIIVDGQTRTPEQRGMLVVAIARDGTILTQQGFDTYLSPQASDQLAGVIEHVPSGTIVALASYDEGTKSWTPRAQAALQTIGAQTVLKDVYGAAYAVVGIKGSAPGTALEKVDQTAPVVLDIGIGAQGVPAMPEPTIQVLQARPNEVLLAVDDAHAGLLSFRMSWYPGWKVYVDGVETPPVRVNGMNFGIFLPSHQAHRVIRVVFESASAHQGQLISVWSAALLLGLWIGSTVHQALTRWKHANQA